jgi:hypothetical protein
MRVEDMSRNLRFDFQEPDTILEFRFLMLT